jgi:hypothetical protein
VKSCGGYEKMDDFIMVGYLVDHRKIKVNQTGEVSYSLLSVW